MQFMYIKRIKYSLPVRVGLTRGFLQVVTKGILIKSSKVLITYYLFWRSPWSRYAGTSKAKSVENV